MYKVLFFISIIIILIESMAIFRIYKNLALIKTAIDDVISGNTNRRIMLNNNISVIAKLVNSINAIIEIICKTHNEKVSQTNMMKRMISNISHDFKTPLTSLIGYIELIEASKGLSVEEVREYLKVIYDKAYFLNSILENFFYLARLESNDEKFNIERINLTDTIKAQIVLFYDYLKRLGKEPAIDIPEEDIYVVADKLSVNRIVNNLLSNSLKYGKDGDKVGISITEDTDYAYVEIWDNGKGIADKDLPLIFERLYTVEDSRSSKLSGTGIGLSIVKQLVINNKGTISVKSIPFERTSFTFSLPKSRNASHQRLQAISKMYS